MSSPTGPLISVAELNARLTEPGTVVVDCRFSLTQPAAGRRAYEAGHIPGAVYAHLDEDLARPPRPGEGRHPLPDAARFAATLGRLGIDRESLVIAYDDQSGAIAARLWWLLTWIGHPQRRLLDGGLTAWTAAGLPLQAGAIAARPRPYPSVSGNAALVAETTEIERLSGILLDARAAPRFRGEVEPIDPVAGHVPGARNLPFGDLLGPDGCFLERAQLEQRIRAVLEPADGADPQSVVTMCGSGVTACHLIAALAVTGRESRLYVGSWSEWIRDPQRPVANGD